MDCDRLRISGFSNRAWAEHAIGELRDLGFSAELDLSRGDCAPFAVIVCGRSDKLAVLRSLADGEGAEPDGAAPAEATPADGALAGATAAATTQAAANRFQWSEFVNSMDGLLRS